MKTKGFTFLLVAAGCLAILAANSGFGEPPPKPGPDHKWEERHTTPEGHYIPGRWIKAPPDPPEPPEKPPLPHKVISPPTQWVNPNMQPIAPVLPQHNYNPGVPLRPQHNYVLDVPVAPWAPYLVPPVVNGSLFWYWNYPYSFSGRHSGYRYSYGYPLYGGSYFKPGKHGFHHDWQPSKPYLHPHGALHPPLKGKHFEHGKHVSRPGKHPGKPAHPSPAKPHSKFKHGDHVAPPAKEGKFGPHKK